MSKAAQRLTVVYKALIRNARLSNRRKAFQRLAMVYKGLIRKRKIKQQEQSLLKINNGPQRINQKTSD
jgi:hypothetical protein